MSHEKQLAPSLKQEDQLTISCSLPFLRWAQNFLTLLQFLQQIQTLEPEDLLALSNFYADNTNDSDNSLSRNQKEIKKNQYEK